MMRCVALLGLIGLAEAFSPSLAPSSLRTRSPNVQAGSLSSSGPRLAAPSLRAAGNGRRSYLASPLALQMAAKKVAVGIVGPGLVGGELIEQIESTQDILKKEGIEVTVAAIANMKGGKPWMLCKKDGMTFSAFKADQDKDGTGEDGDFTKMAEFLKSVAPNAVMFDTTAAEPVSEMYAKWLDMGVHVVTPNKKVGSGPLDRYTKCKGAVEAGKAKWGYETTVGAGLPITHVLKKDLLQTGDKVKKIEGIFSGTLSYIFNTYKPGMKFSDVIADAKGKGFTEPDPRDDLAGMDVARKVVILARECGLDVELDDVPVASLVPKELQDWQPEAGQNMADAFIEEMKAFDSEKDALIKDAEDSNQVLRYVGVVDVENKKVSVALSKYPKTHPFAGTQYADNIVAFDTERYTPQPLVVQGPGAGAAVTAAGIYADFLRIVDTL